MVSRRLFLQSSAAAFAHFAPGGLTVSAASPTSAPTASFSSSGEEFVGPFTSWANLKSVFGAKGDGATDDTAALQSALNAFGSKGASPVLYIPAGTYNVSATLKVIGNQGLSIVGMEPSATVLKWVGPRGGTLLHINGVAYSRFTRMTFDGASICGILVDQSSDPSETTALQFDTGNQYSDNVFQNAETAIRAGVNGGAAESSVLRCVFNNISGYGAILKNFNALDWWFWRCVFNDVGTALSNNPGAGAFHAYGSFFNSPNGCDVSILNTGNFNFRDNYSKSRQFIYEAFYYTNAAPTRLQGNTIDMPIRADGFNGASVYVGNMGPLIATDNILRSSRDAPSPAPAGNAPFAVGSLTAPDVISVGDTFTVATPISAVGYTGGQRSRLIAHEDRIVSSSALTLSPPTVSGVLPNKSRTVIEVSAGSGSAAIQHAIAQAAALNGSRPVVHLPSGVYQLSAGIVVPPCDLQLTGDGFGAPVGTRLMWGGSGAAITLQGPSHVTLRELYINAGTGTGVAILNADQPGSRIYLQQAELLRSTIANLCVDGTDRVLVECHDICVAYTATAPASTGAAVEVVGGPLAAAGHPQEGRTFIASGSGGDNYITHRVSKGGNLTVRDMWYEGRNRSTYALVSDNSTFMLEGSRIALPIGNGPAFEYTRFSGQSTILCSAPDNAVSIDAASNGSVWVVGNNFSQAVNWLTLNAGSARTYYNQNRRYDPANGSVAIPDVGSPDSAWIIAMLAQLRATHPSIINELDARVTDVRVYRVEVELGAYGIRITP